MCFDSDFYPEFYEAEIRKARKNHRCDWCRRGIAQGTQYQSCVGKCDGEFFSTKICNLCHQDSLTIVRHEIDEGCHWNEAWPTDVDSQSEWFSDHEQVRQATEIRDLNQLKAELDEYWKESKDRAHATDVGH